MIIEAIKFAIEAIKLELDATTPMQLSESTEALCHAKDVLQHALSYASKSGWKDLTEEESMSLMLDKKDAPFDLVAAAQERLREKNTPAEYAMGYAEGFNDACKPKQGGEA